uniref:Ribonuclease G n=1 Tax=Magnetococcus massalia (strain MO-1) TaxID=451514 RepID=A0A1S7LGK8_MAGMO|nr:Ribonuclease E [Candidatus Magnetococcus massalia]
MSKRMLVDATHPEEVRVAIVQDQRLIDLDIETCTKEQIKGNIYIGRVTRVEPSLQAAFVDYGGPRQGFLSVNDINSKYYPKELRDSASPPRSDEGPEDPEDRQPEAEEQPEESPSDTPQAEPEAQASEPATEPDAAPEPAGEEPATESQATEPAADAAAAPEPVEPTPAESTEPAQPVADSEADPAEAPQPEFNGNADPAETSQPEVDGNKREIPASADRGESVAVQKDEQPEEKREGQQRGRRGRRGGNKGGSSDRPRRRNVPIQDILKKGQMVVIQVVKEARGTKGASLTTNISLAGRYTVLLPENSGGGGISRKIMDNSHRKKLKEVLASMEIPQEVSLIIRTAGCERTKREITRDMNYLLRLWKTIKEKSDKQKSPSLIHEEGDLIIRTIRDLYTTDMTEVLIEGNEAYRRGKDFMRLLMPTYVKAVQPYKDNPPLFSRYQVENQIELMHDRIVPLKSGGYLVIEPTEALVSIDINSGRSTKEKNVENTAFKTNMQAVDEISRQLRLRDLGGLVVVDFIDMEEKKHNQEVEKRLKEVFKDDRAKIQLGKISQFGLMELSRQRMKPAFAESSSLNCPRCDGLGTIRSVESTAIRLFRCVEEDVSSGRYLSLTYHAPREVANYLHNRKRRQMVELEQQFGVEVAIEGDAELETPHFRKERVAKEGEGQKGKGQQKQGAKQEAKQQGQGSQQKQGNQQSPASKPENENSEEKREQENNGQPENSEEGGEKKKRRRRRRRRKNRDGGENTENSENQNLEEGSTEEGREASQGETQVDGNQAEDSEGDASTADENGRGEESGEGGEKKRRRRRRRRRRGGGDRAAEGSTESPQDGEATGNNSEQAASSSDGESAAAPAGDTAQVDPAEAPQPVVIPLPAESAEATPAAEPTAKPAVAEAATEEATAEAKPPKAVKKPRRKAASKTAKAKSEEAADSTEATSETAATSEAPSEEEAEPVKKKPVRRRRTTTTRKKKVEGEEAATEAKAESKAEEPAAEADSKAEAEEKPKKKVTRKRAPRKKKVEEAPKDDAAATAAEGEPQAEAEEKPKKKVTRKRAPRKKKVEEAPKAESAEAPTEAAPATDTGKTDEG